MRIRLYLILISALWLAVCGYAQIAPLAVTLEGVTPTQAVFSYDTADASACTVTVAEAATPAAPVHDVDPALFTAAGQDLSRPSTFAVGTRRYVTIGLRTSDTGADGKLYSRALQAATDHLFSVSCAHAAGSLAFTTQNPPLGSTYPDVPPFHPAGFGNYAWPTVDWLNPSKTYIDPMTGLLLKPAHPPNPQGRAGEWGNQPVEFAVRDAFDLNHAWSATANLFAGSTAGPFATYSGANSDPLFLPFPRYSQNTDGTIAAWYPESAMWEDVRLTLYGYGSDANPENRKLLVCLAAFYVPAQNQCSGQELELTLPAGSAGQVATPNFPQAAFGEWKLGRYLTKEEAGIPNGDATVANSVVTWVDGTYFPVGMPAGVKIKLGASWYTVASVDNATQITLQEAGVTLAGKQPYQLGGFGLRLRKKTALGTVQLNTSVAWGWTQDPGLPLNGVADICNKLSVTVDYQADGVTPLNPPQPGNLCLVGNAVKMLLLLLPATGETRVISGLQHSDAGSTSVPQLPYGAFSTSDPLTLYGLHGDDVVSSLTDRSLYRITYNPGVCHFRAWAGNSYGFGGTPPNDCVSWSNLTPNSQGRGVVAQFQTGVAGNPFWDAPAMSQGVLNFDGVSGSYALFSQLFGGPQDSPCFVALFDVSTGNLVQVLDTFGGSANIRFTGCHTVPILTMDKWIGLGLASMGGRYGAGYLSGPFQIQSIDALSKDGGTTWSNDTSLSNLDIGPCTTTDPAMIAKGATGNHCVKLRISSEVPCNVAPANGDAARFPCPWNTALAGPMPLQVGDYMSDMKAWPSGPVDGKNEKMLIVSKKGIGGGHQELEVMRWAACDNVQYYGHLNGGEQANTHATGWLGYMSGTGMCSGADGWFDGSDPTHTFYIDAAQFGHQTLGPAAAGMYATVGEGGSSRIGPIPGQFSLQATYALNLVTTTFGGVSTPGGHVQSYPNLGQWTASDSEKGYAFDLRHYNPDQGVGGERPSGLWAQNYALVAGTRQLYKIDNGTGVYGKVFPYLAFAGRYLLKDLSGPGSSIGDGDAWKFCVAYKAGECRAGSAVNDTFVNVPRASLANTCVVNTYALNSPCFTTPYNYAASAIQFQITRDDVAGTHYRELSMALTGPGRQYQFTTFHVTPEGHWGFVGPGWIDGVRNALMLVKIPPAPVDDGIDRTTFLAHRVDIAADGVSSKARIRFGYAENGPITSFFCTSRQEACLTDSSVTPFAYEQSDALNAAPCGSSGCTLYVPQLPGRVLYFRVERLDNSGKVISVGPMNVSAGKGSTISIAGPTVSITSPVAGATVSGKNVTVTANAAAGSGLTITSVQFKVDNVNQGAAVTSSPYSIVLDSTKLTNGTHAVTAVATDSSANSTTSAAVSITVNNTATAVTITAPAAGATVSGNNVKVTATATAAAGLTISSVQFKVDSTNLGAAVTASPYNVVLDATKLLNGPHSLTAVVTDSSNATATSAVVNITVTGGVIPAAPIITGFTPGNARNNFDGFVGMQFTIGSTALNVTSLGRIYIAGNNASHTVKLVNVSDGSDVPGGAVTVQVASGTIGQFTYAQLPSPITLPANTSYYLVSQESNGGDMYYDVSTVTATNVVAVNSPVYFWSGYGFYPVGVANASYVPVNLLFTTGSSAPPTVSITTPTAGATVSGASLSVSATATAAAGLTIASVQFKLDGTNQGSAVTASPYSITVDTTKLTNGTHSLTAVATDSINSSTTSAAVGITVANGAGTGGGGALITAFTPGAVRNNFTGLLGMQFTVGSTAMNVTALGRIFIAGNTNSHTLKVVRVSDGYDVTGASVTIPTGGTAGQFTYGQLAHAVTLQANTSYYLVSDETSGGDQSFDAAPVTATAAASVNGPVYWNGYGWGLLSNPGNSFVPVNLLYTTGSGTPPTVSVTAPAAGTTVSGNSLAVSASATAGPGLTISGVQFKIDGNNQGAAVSSNPYSILVDTTKLTNGQHTLTAVATDSANNSATSAPVNITVSNTGTAVAITAPAAGATVSGSNVTVSATATPGTGLTITKVQFQVDSVNQGAAVTASPYNLVLDTTKLTNGAHSLTAVATDSANNTVASTAVSITVSNTGTTVAITAPAAGATVSGSNVTVSATATPGTGLTITKVQFQVDSVNQGAAVTASPYNLVLDTTKLTNGAHSLTAVATDSANNTVASTAVSITVNNAGTTVAITAPAAGATVSGNNVTVSATATPGTGLTITKVQFQVDSVNQGAAVTASPYNLVLDTTKLTNGAHSLTAVATDSASKTVTSAPVSITVNNAGTTVSITAPAAGATVSGSNVTVSATATPGTGLTITKVQFQVDSVNQGAAVTASPYNLVLDTTKLTNGPHLLTAVATDSANNSITSAAVSVVVNNGSPPPAGTALVTGFNPGSARNNFPGWLGMQFTVGSTPLTVNALGRIYIAGNNGSHIVKLVAVSDGNDVPGGAVTISFPSGTPGQFTYAQLPSPVTLPANTSYYLASQEVNGGDQWFDVGAVTTTNAVSVNSPVYYWPGYGFYAVGIANSSYVPVSLLYGTSSGSTPPAVAVTSPSAGATVSGKNVTVSATAAAGTGLTIASVQFKVDGGNQGSPVTTSPYTIVLDSTKLTNGAHTLTAVATDSANSSTTSAPVSITVNNNSTTVAITAPAAGATISGNNVAVTAAATAGTGLTITKVQFQVDNVNQGAAVTNSPYGITLDSTKLTNGSHTLTAVATDSANNAVTSPALSVTVNNGITTVALTAPAAGATVSGNNVTVSATATPAPGLIITSVQFKLDTVNLGAPDTTSPYGIVMDTTKLANGPHTLTATATDSANNSVTSAPVTITVNNATGTGTALVTGFVQSNLRADFSGQVGMQFTVGSAPLTVTSLGRIYVSGNSGSHIVKLARVSDGADVPGGSVTISLGSGTPGQFTYAQLPSPVTLAPNTAYYLTSQELGGGDQWYNITPVTTTNAVAVNGPVYFWPGYGYYLAENSTNSYVPVSLLYSIGP